MTTEIVLMNSSAVVLAADSTVTISANGSRVHYPGVDKIFGLTTGHSVGIMINGNANFLTIPWDAVVKQFRDEVLKGKKSFNTLTQYSETLSNYIENTGLKLINDGFFISEEHAVKIVNKIINDIKNPLASKINSDYLADFIAQKKNRALSGEKIAGQKADCFSIFCDCIKIELDLIKDAFKRNGSIALFEELEKNPRKKLSKKSIENIENAINNVVGKEIKLPQEIKLSIYALVYFVVVYDADYIRESDIIVSGFGADDYHPITSVIKVKMRIDNIYAITFIEKKIKIKNHEDASIKVFGEGDSIETFLYGISQQFKQNFQEAVNGKIKSKRKAIILETVSSVAESIKKELEEKLLSSIARLPKQFLSAMAENLIMLSSIKTRVKDHDGSVGGPVSVAVISKGDGFVWIKREHYFDIKLNPHYLSRYNPSIPMDNQKKGVSA